MKSFGKLMVGEHHALNLQGDALAKKLNVTPMAPANDQSEMQARAEMDSLTALAKGVAWDKAYIAYEVGYHQAVMDIATKALAAGAERRAEGADHEGGAGDPEAPRSREGDPDEAGLHRWEARTPHSPVPISPRASPRRT